MKALNKKMFYKSKMFYVFLLASIPLSHYFTFSIIGEDVTITGLIEWIFREYSIRVFLRHSTIYLIIAYIPYKVVSLLLRK